MEVCGNGVTGQWGDDGMGVMRQLVSIWSEELRIGLQPGINSLYPLILPTPPLDELVHLITQPSFQNDL